MKTDKPLNLPPATPKRIIAHWTGGSYTPSSLESLAITKIEEAMFWANAALAGEPRPEGAK